MTDVHILEKLPSHFLLQDDIISSLSKEETSCLLKRFDLEEEVEEGTPLEDLHDILLAFISSLGEGDKRPLHLICEVLMVFPSLSYELVQSLLESSEGVISKEMMNDFKEMHLEECEEEEEGEVVTLSASQILHFPSSVERDESDKEECRMLSIDKKSLLVVIDDEEGSDVVRCVAGISMMGEFRLHSLFALKEFPPLCRCPDLPYGIHDFFMCYKTLGNKSMEEKNGDLSLTSVPINVTSVVFDYCLSLERIFDLFHYSWTKHDITWTSELEGALLHLLIAVDDDLVALVRSWKSMMSAFGGMGDGMGAQGMMNDLENMLQMVQTDATEALRVQSANAIGRLHQVLTQFAEMSSGPMAAMMNMPPVFLNSIEQFILAKLQASKLTQRIFVEDTIQLVVNAKRYSSHLHLVKINATNIEKLKKINDFVVVFEEKLRLVSPTLSPTVEDQSLVDAFFSSLTATDIKTLEALKPCQLDSLMSSSGGGNPFDDDVMRYLPSLSLQDVANPTSLKRVVARLAEKTFGDAIMLGNTGDTGLGGYTMTCSNRSMTCAILSSLLNAGLAYVATAETSRLMGHFPMWRSTLSLKHVGRSMSDFVSGLPTQVRKRIKDMKRIFRNKIHKKLSFRLNFDLSHSIELLRHHHGVECWVGEELEQVWNVMAATDPPQLMVFQLYYGDELVAADFAHPVCGGKAVYVATRFSARGHSKSSRDATQGAGMGFRSEADDAAVRTMQPGFILALLECRWLQERGCLLWDLGGYNLSPLMQYKQDLAGPASTRPRAYYQFQRIRDTSTGGGGNPWLENDECIGEEPPICQWGAKSGDTLVEEVVLYHLLGHYDVN